MEIEPDPSYAAKHSTIFKKLGKIQPPSQLDATPPEDASDVDPAELQDLAPLPQPELPRDRRLEGRARANNLDWLATPQVVAADARQSFASLGVSPFMLKNLAAYASAFAVQCAVLSLVMPEITCATRKPDVAGDVLVNAATGSGKTLAYAVPIVEALHKRTVPRVRAVVLVPTRPLMAQVRATFVQVARGTNLTVAAGGPGADADIVVSTPGRLVDQIASGTDLQALQFLVIDEADRLLNQSFQNWSDVVMRAIRSQQRGGGGGALGGGGWRPQVQKFIFSATLTTDAGRLARLEIRRPRLVVVKDDDDGHMFSVPPTLAEYSIHLGSAKASLKPVILARFLAARALTSDVLVFTRSNEGSMRLARLLTMMGVSAAYLNSTNNTASARAKLVAQFQRREVGVLVATDLMARGIDVSSIKTVVNYDLPNSAREYVHRVGRTARAQQAGAAYSLMFGKGEAKWFRGLMKEVGRGKEIAAVEVDTKALVGQEDEALYEKCLAELQREALGASERSEREHGPTG